MSMVEIPGWEQSRGRFSPVVELLRLAGTRNAESPPLVCGLAVRDRGRCAVFAGNGARSCAARQILAGAPTAQLARALRRGSPLVATLSALG